MRSLAVALFGNRRDCGPAAGLLHPVEADQVAGILPPEHRLHPFRILYIKAHRQAAAQGNCAGRGHHAGGYAFPAERILKAQNLLPRPEGRNSIDVTHKLSSPNFLRLVLNPTAAQVSYSTLLNASV